MNPKVSDEQLLATLTEVFRTSGFEGASLAMISTATGLQKSSLYHRFPGGKNQMASAVLQAAGNRLAAHVLAPLHGTGSVRNRVKEVATRIAEFYGYGKKSCLLNTLSVGLSVDAALAELLRQAYGMWIDALSKTSIEAGLLPAEAQRRAEDVLVRLEGALVVARITQNESVFARVLADLPDMLCTP